MRAEIICIGTELLLGDVVNTNGAYISRRLAEVGIGTFHQTVVGDNRERIRDAVSRSLHRVELMVTNGGLGPTDDDLTREVVAGVLGLPLHQDETWAVRLREMYAEFQRNSPEGHDPARPVPQNILRQALVPQGAVLLPNSRGSAPGLLIPAGSCTVVLTPGPPEEMRAVLEEEALPRLVAMQAHRETLVSRRLHVTGLGESRAADMLGEILTHQGNPTVAPLAGSGGMHFRITARAGDRAAALALIAPVEERIRAILGDHLFGADDDTLESVVVHMLKERGLTVGCAESCTGGLLTHHITNVTGSSAVLRGSVVAYHNDIKLQLLGVEEGVLEEHGAVSEAAARQMAAGVTQCCGSDIGVAITGIAGPGGGTAEKPVGLVYIAVAWEAHASHCTRYHFSGSREQVKNRAVRTALNMVRHLLLSEVEQGTHLGI